MNKVDVLYKNYNIQSSGFNDLLKNCDLSLVTPINKPSFTSDEKFSKILTKASITKYALKQQHQQHPHAPHQRSTKEESTTEIKFQKHPRNFDDEADLVSTDSRESITNDHILRTKFQQHKKNFDQIKQLLPKNSDENLWENYYAKQKIIKSRIESVDNNMECATKLKRSRDNVNCKLQSDSSASSVENTVPIRVQKVPKVKKSRDKVSEHIQTNITENNNNNPAHDEYLGVHLTSILMKLGGWFGELSAVIHEGINPIDGAEDYIVRETRCKEFATRFARQYDYEFSRLLGMLRTLVPRIPNRLTVTRIAQNITKSCQIILQATMQYCTHIPTTLTSIEKKQYNVHVKFHQMLKNIIEYLLLVKKIGKTFLDVRNCLDSVEEVEKKCSSLMLLVEEKFMKPPPPPKVQPKIVKAKLPPKDPKKSPYQSQSIEKRLSMYSMSFKNRAGKQLGPKRINVQSRYKTAGIVKAPVSDNADQEKKDSDKKKLIAQKRSSQILCDGSSSTIEPPRINEDEIETMVEKVAKSNNNKTHLHIQTHHHELRNKVETLLQSWTELANEKKEDATNNKEMIVTQMLNLFEELQDGSQKLVTQNLLLEKSISEHDELSKSQISVTGPKNAKLIFIKDKSLYGSLSNTTVPPNSEYNLIPPNGVVTKTNDDNTIIATLPITQNTKNQYKQHHHNQEIVDEQNNQIDAVAKCTIVKKTISKAKEKSFINILKYRKDYQCFTSQNHMYRKGRVQPWHITNKIAERLLTNLLFSVLSEINLNEIVEQIYKAEFE